jgi:hypothetical protein
MGMDFVTLALKLAEADEIGPIYGWYLKDTGKDVGTMSCFTEPSSPQIFSNL